MSENHNQSPSSEKKIYSIGLHRIRPMQNHPFSVRDDEEMTALMESIRQCGVLTPITVRAIRKETGNETDYFEIISGHRRYHACQRLKLDRIPANIVNLDRNQAVIAMVDSNLHREHLLPSEKAFAYKMKLEALDRQGQKPTLCPQDTKPVDSATEIAESAEESRRQIFRYIRLTSLAKGLLDLVDAGRIAFRPAVELSYLNEQEQADLLEIIETEERTPSLSQAVRLKKTSREGGEDCRNYGGRKGKPKGDHQNLIRGVAGLSARRNKQSGFYRKSLRLLCAIPPSMSGQGGKVKKYPLQLSLGGSPRSYRVNHVDFLVESRFVSPPCKTDLRDRFEKIIRTGSARLTIPEETDKIKGGEYDPTVGKENNE